MDADFVSEAIQELLVSGSVVEVSGPRHVVNPLSVSIQSCGKIRLILDLRHVNKHTWKEKFKFEDIRNACFYPFLLINLYLNLILNLATTILIFCYNIKLF